MSKFAHLHTHSHYSLLDGLSKIDQVVKRTKEFGMDTIALTDHGVLYGAIDFYKAAREKAMALAGNNPNVGYAELMAQRGVATFAVYGTVKATPTLTFSVHTPVAGVLKFGVDPGTTVVCVLTGHGLKDPDIAISQIAVPTPIDADTAAIRAELGL